MTSELATINGVRGYIDENGTAQLNLEDVARGLGFTQVKSGAEYVRFERVNGYLTSMGFPQLVGKEFIPENVFYRLAMKGETETAQAFQAMVADEILPAIRKTGTYSVAVPRTFAEALRLAADQQEKLEEQQRLLELAQPKVEFFDQVANSRDAIPIGHAAKVLNIKGIGQNRLFQFLRDRKILLPDNMPYQEYIDRGYFRIIEQKYTVKGEMRVYFKTLVYQKGLAFIRKLLSA